mmetsp:Transcript_42602/g.76523  ORF Transcript_42602/g.76523 Transcript_42602/m.76523 type:complete len:283 (-) Transcript_42602:419-1267(-)
MATTFGGPWTRLLTMSAAVNISSWGMRATGTAVWASAISAWGWLAAETTALPLAVNATQVTGSAEELFFIRGTACQVLSGHKRTVQSSLQEATHWLLGLKHTCTTPLECPQKVIAQAPVRQSHTLTVLSLPPVASHVLSGAKATAVVFGLLTPSSLMRHSHRSSHRYTCTAQLIGSATASIIPWGEKARALHCPTGSSFTVSQVPTCFTTTAVRSAAASHGPDSCRLTTAVSSFSALSGCSSHDAVVCRDTAPISSPMASQDSVRAMAVRRAPAPGSTATCR